MRMDRFCTVCNKQGAEHTKFGWLCRKCFAKKWKIDWEKRKEESKK